MATGLPVFTFTSPKAKDFAEKMTKVIQSDLESSGLFGVIDQLAYLQKFKGIEDAPSFVDWQAINAEALIQGHVDYLNDRQIRVSFRLWDVFAAQELYSATLEVDTNGWRRVAHMIADSIYKRITGEEGEMISGITEDREHDLWISSTRRMVHLKVSRGEDGAYVFDSYVYNDRDGLQNCDFNLRSIKTLDDGTIVAGGLYGVNVFNPDKIRYNKSLPKVLLSGLFSRIFLS